MAAVTPAFTGGRTGEGSRDGLGDAVADDVVELSRGVVEERLQSRGDEDDVCSDRLLRLEVESARLSPALSFEA